MEKVSLRTGNWTSVEIKNINDNWDNDLDDSSLLEEEEVDDDIFEEREDNNY